MKKSLFFKSGISLLMLAGVGAASASEASFEGGMYSDLYVCLYFVRLSTSFLPLSRSLQFEGRCNTHRKLSQVPRD